MSKSGHGGHRFATTRWSLVRAAGGPSSAEARAALEALCEAYWYPLYAFIPAADMAPKRPATWRRRSSPRSSRRGRQGGRSRRGRFRSFLLAACANFLGKEVERGRALKRGGGRRPLSLDFEAGEGRYL